MNLSKEETKYLILLLKSRIERLESLDLSDFLLEFENAGAVKTPKRIIEKLQHYQSTYSKMNEIKEKRRKEKTQRNSTFILN